MRKLCFILLAICAQASQAGSFRAGIVVHPDDDSIASVPRLVRVEWDRREEFTSNVLHTFAPADRARTSLVVSVPAPSDPAAADATVSQLVAWAAPFGAFESIGLDFDGTADLKSYAAKSLSVQSQGRGVAPRSMAFADEIEDLEAFGRHGGASYIDTYLIDADRPDLISWIQSNDPSKEIAVVREAAESDVYFLAADAFRSGASTAYLDTRSHKAGEMLENFNRTLAGDWAVDKSARFGFLDPSGRTISPDHVVFVRGEDLQTLIVPVDETDAARILRASSREFESPKVLVPAGTQASSDTAVRGQELLVGIPRSASPLAILLSRREAPADLTKETIDIATARGLSVEEIIRNHQAYFAYQETALPRYIARNETDLRFNVTAGESIEATLAGDHFFDGRNRNDWVWSDFLLNGVRWKYGRIPELPLVQPEKVTQLPLAIHFDDDYRYELVRETALRGLDTYEVRFEPQTAATTTGRPRYRGTVWIDKKSWARVRIQMIAMNLTGEVLSNEERVDYAPFALDSKQRLADASTLALTPRELLWIPSNIEGEQVVSVAGRSTVIRRSTEFSNFRIGSPEFDSLLASANASQSRMVRDTEGGLKYLERRDDGTRVVKEGFDTSRLFLLGGIYHDEGLEYPVVPLGGVNYFNFDLAGRGLQTNVFFAGVVIAANLTDPTFLGTRTNVGADFFGIALSSENKIRRNNEEILGETVKSRGTNLWLRAGHPFLEFGKFDTSLGISFQSYTRAEDTAAAFVIPQSTFVLNPGIEARYDRWGWTFAGSLDYGIRTRWEPWGLASEYSDDQKNFTRFGATIGKSFYLPKFQRLGVEVNYVDGRNLDRFSKYEFSFFGGQRIRGIESGSLRAESALVGHLSYGLVFNDQFRIETFYDYGQVTDLAAGYDAEVFQGIGIAGQTVGPFGTLLRLDIGRTIGANAQDGFVANVVFLKLFQ